MKKVISIAATCILMILLLLAVLVLLTRHPHELPQPKYDLNSLQEVVIESQDGTEDNLFRIKENLYIAYCSLDKSELSCGDAIGYFINDDHFCYFLKIDGLSESEWVMLFNDRPNRTEEYILFKNINTTQIPELIETVAPTD